MPNTTTKPSLPDFTIQDLRSGGVRGVVLALAEARGLSPRAREIAALAAQAHQVGGQAELDQFWSQPAMDANELAARIGESADAVRCVADALETVATLIERNPGRAVTLPNPSRYGHGREARVFD